MTLPAEVPGSFYALGLYTAYLINFVISPSAKSGLASGLVVAASARPSEELNRSAKPVKRPAPIDVAVVTEPALFERKWA